MRAIEVGQLVAKIRLGDNRQVDRAVLLFWAELVGDLEYEDALAAVNEHRRTKPGVWLEPGHVIAGAKVSRERRQLAATRGREIEPTQITLDREEFERDTLAAIEAERERKKNQREESKDA